MSKPPRVTLHGGPDICDGLTLPVPRLAQGIIVYGTLFEPPAEPAPYYPDWHAVPWGEDLGPLREAPACDAFSHGSLADHP